MVQKMADEITNSNPLLADHPIISSDQDRLGRSEFARNLASQLTAYDDPSCLVIALFGPWGSGKSSLLNLLAEAITTTGNAHGHEPVVLRFNPWNFSTIDQLIIMFFRDLGTSIGRRDSSKVGKTIGNTLEIFGSLLAPGELSPIGSQYFSMASKSIKALGARLKNRAERSLEQIKGALNQLLDKLERRIIVLVDDIDRLDSDNMRLMFRLIRLNADFRHTTYVLAFDRMVADKVLSVEQGISGEDYLKKIVQVGFDIPPPEPIKLQRILIDELNKLIKPMPEEEWDSDRWQELYGVGLRHLFKNPRDIVRYANGLKVSLLPLIGEVNTVDFVGLEAIRTFKPILYDFIRENRDVFVGPAGGGGSLEELVPTGQNQAAAYRPKLNEVFEAGGEHLKRLISVNKLTSFLQRLDDLAEQFPKGNILIALLALFDIADSVPFESKAMLEVRPQWLVSRAAFRLLSQITDPTQRINLLKQVVEDSRGLSSLVSFVGLTEQDQTQLFSNEEFEQIKKHIVKRITTAAEESTLGKAPQLGMILFRWRDWAGDKGPKDYVLKLVV